MNILITGANGFVGFQLLRNMADKKGHKVIGAVRRSSASLANNQIAVGDIDGITDWSSALLDKYVVIHAAGRAHVLFENDSDSLAEFRKVNVDGSLNLARQAAAAGVKRFIFISSIKVNGKQTLEGKPFKADDTSVPEDHYGASKLEAEQGLQQIADETGMEVVIIRPPLVYGPGVKANFASMMNWINKGFPLPFGAINNKRSLVAIENLISFIIHCIAHPKAANEIFIVSDDDDVSITELIQKTSNALGKKLWLAPVPPTLLKFGARLLGKSDMTDRLLGSLQVDITKAKELLGWKPVITMDEQLQKIADAYLNEKTV